MKKHKALTTWERRTLTDAIPHLAYPLPPEMLDLVARQMLDSMDLVRDFSVILSGIANDEQASQFWSLYTAQTYIYDQAIELLKDQIDVDEIVLTPELEALMDNYYELEGFDNE